LCGSLRFEINEHSCQMWWTWKACVCKSGWFWALQNKRMKLYLHQANDGLGDNLMEDTRIVWWFTRSCWSKWSSELSLSLKYPFKVDIYSLGVACYEILTRCVPFYNSKLKKLHKRIKDGLKLDISEQCFEQLSTLGSDMLSSQPCTTFILRHLWHFGIYVPFMFITLDENVHWFQILMGGKSPSRLEMVLKGFDNQLEIATLDS
jgi:serine/threonine protein kinase